MTWFKCGGGGGGIPAILKSLMNSVFNKKFGTAEIYPPETWPDTVNLMGPLEEKTVSGSIVTFDDGSDDVPLKQCEVTIPANLTGVSSVDVVQTGKNLAEECFMYSATNYFVNPVYLKAGAYTISFESALTSTIHIRKGDTINLSGQIYVTKYNSNFFAFTADEDGYYYFQFYKSSEWGDTPPHNAQLEVGSTATAYEPYTAPTTHTANLGRTIYGGEVDVVNGTGTSTHGKVTLTAEMIDNAITYTYQGKIGIQINNVFPVNVIRTGEHICSHATVKQGASSDASYMWFGSATGNKYLYWIGVLDTMDMTLEQWKTWALTQTIVCVYEEPTSTDFAFTPITPTPETALGDNTMWSDDGDLSVVYRSSGTQTIITPTLVTKAITENGTYNAASDNAEGYSSVTVNVPTGTTDPFKVLSINGTAGSETFTADKAGTYMFLVGTSAQGSESITSSVTPDLTFSKQSSDNRGLIGAIYTLAVGDTVTMTNSVVSWVYNTKVVVEMNITVSAVIDSSIVNDGTLPTFTPSISGNALFISMAGGRSNDNSYDRTYTDLNSFEFFGKVETGIFLRIRYGSTVPNYQLYGYDGGCALAIALSVNNPPVLLMGGFNSSSEPEIESENSNDNEEDPINE